MNNVTVVEFKKSAGVYRLGERAGFADPDVAQAYVRGGFASVVAVDTPKVNPAVLVHDVNTKIESLRSTIAAAERDANKLKKDPDSVSIAAEALATAQAARGGIAALEGLVRGLNLPAAATESKQPPAASKAA
jgi:hypothetical protein